MAFRFCDMGRLVAERPKDAAAKLSALIRAELESEHVHPLGPVAAVARQLGVGYATIKRWCLVLDEKGFPVERPHKGAGRKRAA